MSQLRGIELIVCLPDSQEGSVEGSGANCGKAGHDFFDIYQYSLYV